MAVKGHCIGTRAQDEALEQIARGHSAIKRLQKLEGTLRWISTHAGTVDSHRIRDAAIEALTS